MAAGDRLLRAGGRDAHAARVHRELLRLGAQRATSSPRTAGAARALDIYAATRAGKLAPQVRGDPARVYVPNSQSDTVDVIDQRTARIVDHFAVGAQPQHVTPSWDLRTLWVTNDVGNSLTPIDPRTGRHGRPVPVADPYNLYFTADGRRAIVVAEAHRELDFREPHTMRLLHALHVPACAGVDHMDYTADGRFALVSCEFAGADGRGGPAPRARRQGHRPARGRDAAGRQALAGRADVLRRRHGVQRRVADRCPQDAQERFQPTGRGAHGLYPSRDSGTCTSPTAARDDQRDLVSHPPARAQMADPGRRLARHGRRLGRRARALAPGRYNSEVYAISTSTGRLLHRIPVGAGPHGLASGPSPAATRSGTPGSCASAGAALQPSR